MTIINPIQIKIKTLKRQNLRCCASRLRQWQLWLLYSTLDAHNGWADLLLGTPAQGLVDTYTNLDGQTFAGNPSIVYHDFEANDSTASIDDLGTL